MTSSQNRRTLLQVATLLPLLKLSNSYAKSTATPSAREKLIELEKSFGGRLGVFALNTANGKQLSLRADERFPFYSTFKAMLVGAVLAQSAKKLDLLAKQIHYTSRDLLSYAPVTRAHQASAMSVEALCDAALRYSDNTAANLLLNLIEGPVGLTAFARSIGDQAFRLDRIETHLNSAKPGDLRDTTIARSDGPKPAKVGAGQCAACHTVHTVRQLA